MFERGETKAFAGQKRAFAGEKRHSPAKNGIPPRVLESILYIAYSKLSKDDDPTLHQMADENIRHDGTFKGGSA